MVFTDELFGGVGVTCNPTIGPNQGANGIYRITGKGKDRKLEFAGYDKIPRVQHNTENCVANNGKLIPTKDRDVMVQAWYQGGVSVFDFTDPANPVELAYFDRGPLSLEKARARRLLVRVPVRRPHHRQRHHQGARRPAAVDKATAAAARNRWTAQRPDAGAVPRLSVRASDGPVHLNG